MRTSADIFETQDALQAEASAVEADLGLTELLQSVGQPVRVGSSALGLMVWRDLDITVICPTLDAGSVAAVGARLAVQPRVRQVVFRNDTGSWNTDPDYPDGLYLGLKYRTGEDVDWQLDIWFVDQPERQPDLIHLQTFPAQLTPETRRAILLIKSAWAGRSEYGTAVGSFDIYSAVLNDGVRTTAQFDQWLMKRPAR